MEEYIIISSIEEPQYTITVNKGKLRLKKNKTKDYNVSDNNIIELHTKYGYYNINFLNYSVYKDEHHDEIVAKTFSSNDIGFLFDIVSTKSGIKIKAGDKCLTKSKFDMETSGFVVKAKKCTNSIKQRFLINRIPVNIRKRK